MARFPFPAGTPCAYCNALKKITVDHVPPKCLDLFEEDERRITVPACDPCHRSFSEDDEFFRDMLSMDEKVQQWPRGKEISEAALRGSRRNRKRLESRRKNFRNVTVRTEGIIRVNQPAYYVDGPSSARINGTISRIVKGLFWHEKKEVLPASYEVSNRHYIGYDRYNIPLQSTLSRLYNRCKENGIRSFGGGRFEYGFYSDDNDPHVTCWIMRFYESDFFDFISRIKPRGH